MTDTDIMAIMMLRACGYEQAEIAERTGFSQSSISYRLRRIKERSLSDGLEPTFVRLMCPLLVIRLGKG